MVFSEIIKTRDNFIKDWNVFTWRTKDQKEIDFIIQDGKRFLFIESKLGIHGVKSFDLDVEAKKVFQSPYQQIVVSVAPSISHLNAETLSIPIKFLGEYLASW
jgi:predicted AAA+ superfamily ATPase